MTNIESLKKYVGNVTEEEFMILTTKIYMITDFIVMITQNIKSGILLNNYLQL